MMTIMMSALSRYVVCAVLHRIPRRTAGNTKCSNGRRHSDISTQFRPGQLELLRRSKIAEQPLKMGDFEDIEFGLIDEERYDDVIDHLRNNFFADEPLNNAVSLCRPGEPHAELEEHSLTTLKDGLSQMAVNIDTGQVIGVALNGVQHPGDIAAAQAKLKTMADIKFRKIFDLLYGVNRSLDLFTQHGVDKIFECRILSVDKRFRGRGLARELVRRSEITARESGFKVFKEDATGFFSQRVAESLGLQTVRQIRYSDYTSEETGEVVFKMPSPHDTLKIMVKVLQ